VAASAIWTISRSAFTSAKRLTKLATLAAGFLVCIRVRLGRVDLWFISLSSKRLPLFRPQRDLPAAQPRADNHTVSVKPERVVAKI
jgi:hypothetical protein